MQSSMKILAAIALALSLSAPSFAQTSSGDAGANATTGTNTGGNNADSGVNAGVGATSQVTPGSGPGASTTLDMDANGQITLEEFNTGIASQDDTARQETMRGFSQDQITTLRGECEKPEALNGDFVSTCDYLKAYNPM